MASATSVQCSICEMPLDEKDDVVITECHHQFHRTCAQDRLLKRNRSDCHRCSKDSAVGKALSQHWFVSIIESPSNLINRRLHLIIAWPYIRSIFLIDNDNSLFIKQIDEQYNLYNNILNEIETSWNEFQYASNIFDRDILFYNTFESIVYYPYQWIDSYLHPNSSSNPFICLTIPFDKNLNPDEHFCQLISYSSNSFIKDIYIEKWLEENPSKSLLFHFNIRSLNLPFGLYDKIRQQNEFWSKFPWLNGSFLQCNRSKLEEFVRHCLNNSQDQSKTLSFQLIEQSLNE